MAVGSDACMEIKLAGEGGKLCRIKQYPLFLLDLEVDGALIM